MLRNRADFTELHLKLARDISQTLEHIRHLDYLAGDEGVRERLTTHPDEVWQKIDKILAEKAEELEKDMVDKQTQKPITDELPYLRELWRVFFKEFAVIDDLGSDADTKSEWQDYQEHLAEGGGMDLGGGYARLLATMKGEYEYQYLSEVFENVLAHKEMHSILPRIEVDGAAAAFPAPKYSKGDKLRVTRSCGNVIVDVCYLLEFRALSIALARAVDVSVF